MGRILVNDCRWNSSIALAAILFIIQIQTIVYAVPQSTNTPKSTAAPTGDNSQSPESKPEGYWNLKTKTLGGMQFWTDVRHVSGWRIQRNEVTEHFRLIDNNDYRHAWGNLAHCQMEMKKRIESGQLKPNSGRVVILLHGLIRTHNSLSGMAKFLQNEGNYQIINFEYASSRRLVGDHAAALKSVIDNLGPEVTEINFFGHSLGNIVVRHYLADNVDSKTGRQGDPRIARIVMSGPPNQGSRMARLLKHSFLFKVIAGASGGQLSNAWDELEKHLATPKHQFGIIAGGQTKDQYVNNFMLKGKDDFTVSVDETKLVGARDFLVRPLIHSTMMKQTEVYNATLSFFRNGYFVAADKRNPILNLKESAKSQPVPSPKTKNGIVR